MSNAIKQFSAYFREIGAADLQHTGEKNYLAHVIGVYNDLKSWGCDEDLCNAGVFHSIYGTAKFQGFTLSLERRGEVQKLIGERAEQLAYWNCAMNREAFDQTVLEGQNFSFSDRITGELTTLSEEQFRDLMTLHLCDWLEQVPRSKTWGYRRAAYRAMAEQLGGVALEAYDRTFQQEPSKV